MLAEVSRSWSGPFGRLLRDAPMVSAGSAGTPSAMVASAANGRAVSLAVVAARLPLGKASLPPLAEASLAEVPSIPFPAVGAPLAERPAAGVPSDTASSGGTAFAGADLAAVGCCGDRLGGAMMSLVSASCSSPIKSSPVALDVTTVGEPPPEPSGLSVRLSKPSSLWSRPSRGYLRTRRPYDRLCEEGGILPDFTSTHGTLLPPNPLPST